MRILLVLLEIVIGLALVGTVATSTSSGSTALAAFTNAQALVIIIPLIFVAIILFAAVQHFRGASRGGKGLGLTSGLVGAGGLGMSLALMSGVDFASSAVPYVTVQ
jgi:hypothetical protein